MGYITGRSKSILMRPRFGLSRADVPLQLRATTETGNAQGETGLQKEKKQQSAGSAEGAFSFVRDEMRPYAMKLHTRDQAPREGQQPASPQPVQTWQPARQDYLNFLTDSLAVYETFDDIVGSVAALAALRSTGLERASALREDIRWLTEELDSSLRVNSPGQPALQYCAFLQQFKEQAEEMNSAQGTMLPQFICHYYNHYFAHTAGGRMIGKRMADMLLNGKTLRFYLWSPADGSSTDSVDVKQLLRDVEGKIDAMAASWTPAQRLACCEETAACFRFGGSLLSYLRPPPPPP